MSLISVSNLTFAYEGSYDYIFNDVSFRIDTDWKLGFCGRNGRGKTTFLRLLMGQYAYRGRITASVHFGYFPFSVDDMSRDTLDIIRGVSSGAPLWKIQKELAGLTVPDSVLYRAFSTLSNGERTKVLLAGLFLNDHHFMLIDEPTNHLDLTGRETVSRYLNSKKGFILVSHDRSFLDGCIDHLLAINKANIEIQSGNFSSWWHNKQIHDACEAAENERIKKNISRLEEASRRTAEWSDKAERGKVGIDPNKVDNKKGYAPKQAAKAKKLMARSKAIQMRRQADIAQKERLLRNIDTADSLKLYPLVYHADCLIYVKNLSITYGCGSLFRDISFSVRRGDRLVLSGGNGSGKSSVLKLIMGEGIPYHGTVTAGSRLVISYVPQDASFLSGDLDEYARLRHINRTLFMAILRKLDFSRSQFEKDISDYSQGQKKKVLLAGSLCERAHLYIWDEPLNYIDVLSRIQIEALILAYKPTLLFVEHDSAFCDHIATQTVYLAK